MIKLDADMTVQELIEHHPDAIRFFLHNKMLCVGCPTEAFHTLADVARVHGQAPERLIEDLCRSIAATKKSPSAKIS